MEAAVGGGGAAAAVSAGGIALHDFSGRLGEQRVHFHAMRLRDSLFLWVGAAPALASLAVAMCSPRVSVASVTMCRLCRVCRVCRVSIIPPPSSRRFCLGPAGQGGGH